MYRLTTAPGLVSATDRFYNPDKLVTLSFHSPYDGEPTEPTEQDRLEDEM